MSMKVLIADLDWRFAQHAATYLESRAHLVASHSDRVEAIEAARHWQPDLVIVSQELAADGLMAELLSLEPRPAILLTGWMDSYEKVWRVWQQGGDELLMKPVFKSSELHAAIVTALENATTGERTRPAAIPA